MNEHLKNSTIFMGLAVAIFNGYFNLKNAQYSFDWIFLGCAGLLLIPMITEFYKYIRNH